MSTHDPYEAPQAVLDVAEADADGFRREPRDVAGGAGMDWLAAGWRSFTLAPGAWLAIFIVFVLIVLVASFIPLVGIFANLLTVVLMGGIMLGCDAQHRGEPLDLSHLFAGFSRNAGGLVAVGALYLAGTLAIMLVLFAMMFALFGGIGMMSGRSGGSDSALIGGMLAMMLVGMLMATPLLMSFYFAPPLVAINGVGPVDAMALSFRACLRNFFPLLLFFIIAVLASIVAMLPLFLGLFVLYPVLMAANYAAYRDIFYDN